MPRPSLVTSSGPSPVRGFIAAIFHPLPAVPRNVLVGAAHATSWHLRRNRPATIVSMSPSIISVFGPRMVMIGAARRHRVLIECPSHAHHGARIPVLAGAVATPDSSYAGVPSEVPPASRGYPPCECRVLSGVCLVLSGAVWRGLRGTVREPHMALCGLRGKPRNLAAWPVVGAARRHGGEAWLVAGWGSRLVGVVWAGGCVGG